MLSCSSSHFDVSEFTIVRQNYVECVFCFVLFIFSDSSLKNSMRLNTLDPNPTILGWSDPEILVIFENTTLELRVEF